MKKINILLVYSASRGNATMSYQLGWPDYLMRHPGFDVTPMNLADRGVVADLTRRALLWRQYEAVVLMHSVFSNSNALPGRLFDALCKVRIPKVFFIGNEYKLMPEKMAFCDTLGVDLLISQSEDRAIHDLYRERLKCGVAGLPNTGLDPDIFAPGPPLAERELDLGYRGFESIYYLGNDERTQIADVLLDRAARRGLKIDISTDPDDRFDRQGWSTFLAGCKGQLGVEAGGDYFELTDATRRRVNDYMREYPDVSFETIRRLFFDGYENPQPLRIISGRNVEAAGTRTVQILFEGHYSGYFRPDEHYIPLEKDFSNVDEALNKLDDRAFASDLAANAYDVVVSELTYDNLIGRLHRLLVETV